MKKLYLFLLVAIAFPCYAMAQYDVTESFNSDDRLRFEWEEYADKKGSAIVTDGQLTLTCKDKESSRAVYVNLPIDVQYDFKISSTLIVDKIDEENVFAVSIDNDDFVKLGFFISENKLFIGYYENSVEFYGEKEESSSNLKIFKGESKIIKLKGGKEQVVNITLEKKGKRLILSINNMKVYEKINKTSDFIVAPCLGFITRGESVLKIDEVKVLQDRGTDY